jgi:Zn-dependent protease
MDFNMTTVLVFLLFIFSVIIHEIAHAVAARKLGDDTAFLLGRITLDPIKHIDLMWTIIIPAAMYFSTGGQIIFGGAKPVPVNPSRFKRPRKDMMWVALAGPISNILLAILFAMVFRVGIASTGNPAQGSMAYVVLMAILQVVFVNMFLACFNLIPIPPLDGGRVLTGLLPYELAKEVQKIEPYGIMILIGLIVFNFTHVVAIPAMEISSFLLGISFS